MSWNGACKIEPKSTFREASDALAGMEIHGGINAPAETKVAVGVARDAALKILTSGALGKGSDGEANPGFYVSLTGHANPENLAPEGVATDCISVTVQTLKGTG